MRLLLQVSLWGMDSVWFTGAHFLGPLMLLGIFRMSKLHKSPVVFHCMLRFVQLAQWTRALCRILWGSHMS